MDKKQKKNKFKIFNIIMSIMLTLICSLSFTGCSCGLTDGFGSGEVPSAGGGGSSGGGSGGGGSGSIPGGGSSGGSGGGSSGGSQDEEEDEPTLPDFSLDDGSVDNYNDVFVGAIVAYTVNSDDSVFYDKYLGYEASFAMLADRQFTAMATYLYNSLNRIYGPVSGEVAQSMIISGYGEDKELSYNGIINDSNQSIIAGLSSGMLANSDRLNYANSIAGGYDLVVNVDSANSTYTYHYDTAVVNAVNAWRGASSFSIDGLKNALCYIYNNLKEVENPDNEISFAGDADINLKNYYKNVNSANFSVSSNYENVGDIPQLGLNKEFLWNVAYYIAYSIIGESRIEDSIDGFNAVFSNGSIQEIVTFEAEGGGSGGDGSATVTATNNEEVFEKYKGYNVVIKELLDSLCKLQVSSDTVVAIAQGDAEWDKTLFPIMSNLYYEYIDDVNLISEAYNDDDLFGEGDDEDFEYDPEGGEYESIDDPGEFRRLKQIILIPKIDPDGKYKEGQFNVGGTLIGMMSDDDKEYHVEVVVSGLCNGEELASDSVMDGDGIVVDNRLVVSNEYSIMENLADFDFGIETEFGEAGVDGGDDLEGIIGNSFTNNERTITYNEAGSSATFTYGAINVYNQIFGNGGLNIINNYIMLDFVYYYNSEIVDAPNTSLMYFLLYS